MYIVYMGKMFHLTHLKSNSAFSMTIPHQSSHTNIHTINHHPHIFIFIVMLIKKLKTHHLDQRTFTQGSTLTLILAEEEDAGVYQCRFETHNLDYRSFRTTTFARINLGKTEATVEHKVHIGSERLVLAEGDDMILSCNTSKPVPVVWKWEVRIFLSALVQSCPKEIIWSFEHLPACIPHV